MAVRLSRRTITLGLALCLASGGMIVGAASAHAAQQLVVAPVGDTSCGQTTPYHTIQSAVTAASAGDHVYVCPALYQERVVIDNSGHSRNGLNLEGASTNNTFVQFPTSPPPTGPDAIILVNATTGVEVHHLTVEGPWSDDESAGCAQPTHYGIFVEGGGSARIDNNHIAMIQDANQAGLGGCQDGLAVRVGSNALSQTGSGQILNNLIDNYQKNGVTIDGPGTTALVANNTIIGDTVDSNGVNPIIARNGVQFSRSATGQVRNNAISKNEYGGPGTPPPGESPDDNDGAGLLAYNLPRNVQLNNNTLSLNDLGLDLATSSHLVVNNNVATNNRFSGLRAEGDSTGNNIYNNQASGTPSPAGHDCRDDSTGSGTAGTANTWTTDKGRTSLPSGICKP